MLSTSLGAGGLNNFFHLVAQFLVKISRSCQKHKVTRYRYNTFLFSLVTTVPFPYITVVTLNKKTLYVVIGWLRNNSKSLFKFNCYWSDISKQMKSLLGVVCRNQAHFSGMYPGLHWQRLQPYVYQWVQRLVCTWSHYQRPRWPLGL